MIKRTYFYHGHAHYKKGQGPEGVTHRHFSGAMTVKSWFADIDTVNKEILRLNCTKDFGINNIEIFTIHRV